jgi:hypothetical protein
VKRVEVINPISPRIEQLLREFGSNYIDTEDMRNFLKSQREKWSSPLGH